jgi:hypothetical protein
VEEEEKKKKEKTEEEEDEKEEEEEEEELQGTKFGVLRHNGNQLEGLLSQEFHDAQGQ